MAREIIGHEAQTQVSGETGDAPGFAGSSPGPQGDISQGIAIFSYLLNRVSSTCMSMNIRVGQNRWLWCSLKGWHAA